MRNSIYLLTVISIFFSSGCCVTRRIEQWKCDKWGMCHFGTKPTAVYAAPPACPPQPYAPAPTYAPAPVAPMQSIPAQTIPMQGVPIQPTPAPPMQPAYAPPAAGCQSCQSGQGGY